MKALLAIPLFIGFSIQARAEVSNGRLSVGPQILKAFGNSTPAGYRAACISEDGFTTAKITTFSMESLSFYLQEKDPKAETQEIVTSSDRVSISKWAAIKDARALSKATPHEVSCDGKHNTGTFSITGRQGTEPVVFNCVVTLQAYDCGN